MCNAVEHTHGRYVEHLCDPTQGFVCVGRAHGQVGATHAQGGSHRRGHQEGHRPLASLDAVVLSDKVKHATEVGS